MKGFNVIVLTVFAVLTCIPAATAGPGLSVEEASIATGIEELSPAGTGKSFPRDAGKLWCYSKIGGGGEGDSIVHNWYYGERLMAEVKLPINSPLYRTYSSKNILPGWTGQWRVEIIDTEGTLLKTLNFTVE